MISKLVCSDVLAIHCLGNFIFIGIGCTLHIFNKHTFELERKVECIYPYNIHGIIDGPNNKLAVFGANFISVYNVNAEGKTILIEECHSVKQLHDWIITARLSKVKDRIHVSVLLAHNSICIYDISQESEKNIRCEEKCILYGGSISAKFNEDLTIFSGTVFQEILIWEVKHNFHSDSSSVLHRLRGHNGVIFSVIYNPLTRLICSTSDDRTVRLWKVTDNVGIKTKDVNWDKVTVQLIKTMFGHAARVWRSIIRKETIITIGEDSLICTWSLDGELLNKVCAHHGAAIWSIGMSENNKYVFTGGADGAVNALSLTNEYTRNMILLPETEAYSVPKYVNCLSSGTLLIYTENGIIFCYDKMKHYPREILHLRRYSSYCVMQVSLCRSYVCLASRDGYVAFYKETDNVSGRKLEKLLEERVMESRIYSLQWLQSNKILICGGSGILKVFTFTAEGSSHVEAEFLLPRSKERWVTAAIIFEELLVCGDRAGNVHVFQHRGSMANNQTDMVERENEPVQTIAKVHGRIGVQNFTVFNSKLMSAGRDGMLQFYELREDGQKCLYALHKEKMPMDWISGTLQLSRDIFALGFKETEFLIYSMLHHRIVTRIPCGGGHRSWDCMLMNDLITFVYIRSKQIFIINSSICTSLPPILLNGFHPKEVYCILPVKGINRQNVFLSGGEDGTLRVTCIRNTPQKDCLTFQTLGIFDGHISSIKSIALTNVNSDSSHDKSLVFSGGGRAQLKVWEINIKCGDKNITDSDISCIDIACHMLYGTDRHRRKPWQEASQSYVIHPETRYMDIALYRLHENVDHILLLVACADGCIRIFLYNTGSRQIQLKLSAKCVDRCILKVSVLNCEQKIIALIMPTDGIARFIDFTDAISKIFADTTSNENQEIQNYTDSSITRLHLHQGGINSFDLKEVESNKYLLATGGDDNLFSLICFKVCSPTDNEKLSVVSLSKWTTSSAHSAQITGIKFKDENRIYSVGMDQLIIEYNYEYYDGVLSAKLIGNIFTSVTDIQGLALWSNDMDDGSLLCVYGKGFEILSC